MARNYLVVNETVCRDAHSIFSRRAPLPPVEGVVGSHYELGVKKGKDGKEK